MTPADLNRLEAQATTLAGKPLSTMVAVTPGELLELCRLARIGQAQEAQAGKPA